MILLALASSISCLLLALAAVSTALRGSALPARLAATVCVLYGLFAWGFQILGLVGAFSLTAVVPLFVVMPMALVWWRRSNIADALDEFRADARSEIAALANGLRSDRLVLAAIAVIALHVIVRLARALAMPRIGWDDFTYHLFRAGRWVQNGSLALEPAPDAWSYYEFFPWGGDLVWAWALVWRAGDVLIACAAVAIWVTCLPLAYGLARRCQSAPVPSLIVAIALVVLPSQISLITTAYVDNLQLMSMLACALLLLEALQVAPESSRAAPATTQSTASLLLGVGCGLGTLVKPSFLPFFGLAAAVLVWDAIRRRHRWTVPAFVVGATVAIPNLAFNWSQRGSPFYPFRVLDSLPFNLQLAELLSQYQLAGAPERAVYALVALVANVWPQDPFLNIGFTGMVLVLLGIAGAVSLWSRMPAARLYLLWAGSGAVVTLAQILAAPNASLPTRWAPVLGRIVIPALAAILLSARFPMLVRLVLLPVLIAEYFLHAPWQWPQHLALSTGAVLAAVLVAGVAVVAALRVRSWRRGAIAALVTASAVFAIASVHDHRRYDNYRSFAARELDDFHYAPRVGAWPIWQRLDDGEPGRIAMAAGWDGTGHNWFRYGLLGSRLQNDVRYVPITRDGSIVNYADRQRTSSLADRETWLARLVDQRIDWVVLLGPRTLEHEWVEQSPDVFSIELTEDAGATLLARVKARKK